jgi:hypothetical protein
MICHISSPPIIPCCFASDVFVSLFIYPYFIIVSDALFTLIAAVYALNQ